MLASLVLAASLVGQLPGITPQPTIYVTVAKPAPTAQDLAIQAAMDDYAMDVNAGMRKPWVDKRSGYQPSPIRPRLDAPAGVYLLYTWPPLFILTP